MSTSVNTRTRDVNSMVSREQQASKLALLACGSRAACDASIMIIFTLGTKFGSLIVSEAPK